MLKPACPSGWSRSGSFDDSIFQFKRDPHVPDVVGGPEVRRNEHQRPILQIHTNPGLSAGSKCHNAVACLAEKAASHTWESSNSISNLCCGFAGQAHGLLNL
jgi:hypothetical protein